MARLATMLLALALGLGCSASAARRASAQAPPSAETTASRDEALTPRDVVSLQRVIDVAVSPDGRSVAYVVTVPRRDTEDRGGSHREIWLVDRTSKQTHRYTSSDNRSWSPQFSPDGTWLGFLRRDDSGTTQVYRMALRGGEAERLTDSSSKIVSFAWSPDGSSLAYVAKRVESSEEEQAGRQGRDWTLGDVSGTYHRLWRMDLDSREATAVTNRAIHVLQFEWSPDGRHFALQTSDRADVDATMMYSDLSVIEADGGPLRPLASHEGKLGELAWSPDGKRVAFLGADDLHDPTAGVVHVVDLQDPTPRKLTGDLEATGQWLAWTKPDSIVMLADVGTKTALFEVAAGSGKVRRLTNDGPVCSRIDIDEDGNVVACTGSTAEHPREVYAGRLATGRLQRLTEHNPWLASRTLGEQKVVRWKAEDELEVEGVLTLPVGYDESKQYPLAVLVHGGPEGISLDGWNTRSGYPVQLFANAGYVVLQPNYRGSRGRGVAFGKADQKDLGGAEIRDVLAGVDFLASQGIVDPQRVGMGGWSYGGYFSGLAATKYSERFKVAMVGAAITDWISFTGTTEIEHENSLVHWNLWPWEHPELAWERSPVAHAKGSKTATLIVHGTDDTRVPPGQAKELYRALRYFKTPTELVLYPREGHGLSERAHQLDFMKRWLSWFDRHLRA